MSKHHSRLALLLACVQTCAFAGADADKATTTVSTTAPPPASTSFEDSTAISQYLFGPNNAWDSAYDTFEKWKADHHIPITIGANNWWHVDRNEHVYGNGYGVPGERGTYYYFVDFDPSITFDSSSFLKEIGLHSEYRLRDSDDHIRAFYPSNFWFYEAYAYAKTDAGTFKAGLISQQFGIPWDGTWWESAPYFDGYKFDPNWGIDWEKTWKFSDVFSIDSYIQYYVAGSRVNGSEPGADAKSAPGLSERNTGVIRIVPTWQLNKDTKIAIGASVLAGDIRGQSPGDVTSDSREAWDLEATVSWKNWSVFGEFIKGYGATNPDNYVSGGPSDRNTSMREGISYKQGPISYHVNFSQAWYGNPSGHQFIFDPGLSAQLTKNVTLYAEYVKWDVTNHVGVTSVYDDGFELILVWKF